MLPWGNMPVEACLGVLKWCFWGKVRCPYRSEHCVGSFTWPVSNTHNALQARLCMEPHCVALLNFCLTEMATITPLPASVILSLSISEPESIDTASTTEPAVVWAASPPLPEKLCSLCSPRLAAAQASVQTALADDFHTPRAIDAIMSLVYYGNRQLQAVSKVTR